jgi:hypothetical protein
MRRMGSGQGMISRGACNTTYIPHSSPSLCLSGQLVYPVVVRGFKMFELLVKLKQGPCLVGGGHTLKCGEVCHASH